jgi:hypothetical protein
MNLIDCVCKFIQSTKDKSGSEQHDKTEIQPAAAPEAMSSPELMPRDGMSLESAKLAIGRCADNSGYEIHHMENKGRYFTAKVMDSKGRQVKELLVDKLNGKVQFI